MPRATRTDVARRAGVAPSTVSLILGGRSTELGIAAKTEAKVRSAAEELGYIPNAAARALRTHSSSLIAIVLPRLPAHPYMPIVQVTVVAGLQAAESRGYNLLTVSDQGSEDDTLARLRGLIGQVGLAGIISQPFSDPRIADLLRTVGIPVVWMSPSLTEGTVVTGPHVAIDEKQGVDELLAGLDSHALRSVAFLHGPGGLPPRVAYAASRLAGASRIIETGDWTAQAAHREVATLLETSERPTMVWCASDILATGAMRAVSARDLDMGTDISVVGYGDVSADPARSPELTSVRWPLRELVTASMERLMAAVHGVAGAADNTIIPTSVTWGTTALRR